MVAIRVIIVEDDCRFRDTMSLLLEESPLIEVVECYTTGREAICGIIAHRPDVALIDLGLPDMVGVEVIRSVSEQGGPTECLVLTVYDDNDHLFDALRAGALGYIVKQDASLEEIVRAIQDVRDGSAPMSRGLARRILQEMRDERSTPKPLTGLGLTTRAFEILETLGQGYSTRKVAQTMYFSYETVRCHQKNIYRKLQVNSLVEALMVLRGDKK
jgi:DNA-binding NarL/FixJ family response regulator